MKTEFEKALEEYMIDKTHINFTLIEKDNPLKVYLKKDVLFAKKKDDERKKKEILETIDKDELFHCNTCRRGIINIIKRIL